MWYPGHSCVFLHRAAFGNPDGRGGLRPWKSRRERGSGGSGNPGGNLEILEIRVKKYAIRRGVWIFSGITQCNQLRKHSEMEKNSSHIFFYHF